MTSRRMPRSLLVTALIPLVSACVSRDGGSGTGEVRRSSLDVPWIGRVKEVVAASKHSCALLDTGKVVCWGGTIDDQGRATTSATPVEIPGLDDAVAIKGSIARTCAMRSTREILCWTPDSDSPGPVAVAGISDAMDLALGTDHACVLRPSGAVSCWGGGSQGQLGNGALTNLAEQPVAVTGISDATAIVAGDTFTCALRTNGAVACWGTMPGSPQTTVPTPVTGLSGAESISAGPFHACVVRDGGAASCWGRGDFGQLGNGAPTDSAVPVDVTGIADAKAISAGTWHTCAVRSNGEVSCWGHGLYGQLGNGAAAHALDPVSAVGLTDALAVSAGTQHTCALRSGGRIACWGIDDRAQLGFDGFIKSGTPVAAQGLSDATMVASGTMHTCAVHSGGRVSCWGWNQWGQLGTGDVAYSNIPRQVAGLTDIVAVAAGAEHTCVVHATGEVACWGANQDNQLGDGGTTNSSLPVTVSGLSDVVTITAGDLHTCAVRSTGEVACWGLNKVGMLGTTGNPMVPVTVAGVSDVRALALGHFHTCALKTTGEVFCWGLDSSTPNADGTRLSGPTPTAVPGLSGIVAVASRMEQTCAIGATGEMSCWTGRGAPTRVPDISNAAEAALGALHTCVRLVTGEVECSGANAFYDQLGTVGLSTSSVPVLVPGIIDAISISSGQEHTCVRRASGSVACWGRAIEGELGNGASAIYSAPTNVRGFGSTVGDACEGGAACSTGFCVDGVCCATECAGGLGDCQACSTAAGATTNGTCATLAMATPCADDGNVCTVDRCDGSSIACQHSPGNADTKCRDATGACDNAAKCDGVLPACPANALKPQGQICSNVDLCESTEVCSGTSSSCPAATTLPPESCSPIASGSTTVGFLGWSDNSDVGNNPPGSVLLIFNGLTTPGTATVVESTDGPGLPAGFQTVGADHPHYWHIETSAKYASLTICIRYDDQWLGSTNEMMLELWHYNTADGVFEKKTSAGFPEPNSNLICGDVTKLSPFVLVLPIDTTPPILPKLPDLTAFATSTAGAAVTYTVPTATDAMDTSPRVDCAPAPGSIFAPGKTTVTCTAADAAGNTASASFTVWGQYQAPADGSFFQQPINPDGSSVFKRGSTIPVKFKLQGASAAIANLAAHLAVAKVSNGVSGTYVEADSTAACDDGNTFRYDAAAKQYVFNLSTKAMTVGTWSLRADLGDRVEHTVKVSLR